MALADIRLGNGSENLTLYHYSTEDLKELCPPKLRKKSTVIGNNSCTISVFPLPIPFDYLVKFKENGFIRYQNLDNLKLFKVNTKDLLEALVEFRYESKKEVIECLEKMWDKRKRDLLRTIPNITDTEFKGFELITKAECYHKLGLIYASKKYRDFYKMVIDARKNWIENIEYNLRYGNKNQYASFIPHFNITVCDCIRVEKMNIT